MDLVQEHRSLRISIAMHAGRAGVYRKWAADADTFEEVERHRRNAIFEEIAIERLSQALAEIDAALATLSPIAA